MRVGTTRDRQNKAPAAVIAPIALTAALVLLLAALPLSGLHHDAEFPADETAASEMPERESAALPGTQVTYLPDCVLVRFEPGATYDEVRASLAQASSVDASGITEDDVELGFAKLQVAPGYDVGRAIAQTSSLSHILGSQPDFVYGLADSASGDPQALEAAVPSPQSTTAVNDPRAPEQWHLGADVGINAYEAWDLAQSEGQHECVTVAVLDTGCNIEHEDIADNIAATYDAREWPDGRIDDSSGHGTHVCGLVSAVTGNGIGVAGVSYNARLLPVQVFRRSKTDSATLVRAYRQVMKVAREYNVRVVNLSLGGELDGFDYTDEALIAVVEEAYEIGILTVCAAGNDVADGKPYVMFPGDYLKHAMSVIALDEKSERASFSNYNMSQEQRTKDIAAPGVNILSTWNGNRKVLYNTASGTSMACPIVAGTAALMFSANPSLTPGQAIDAIHETAVDLGQEGFDAQTGYGRVDARAAVERALEIAADPASTEQPPESDDALEPEYGKLQNDGQRSPAEATGDVGGGEAGLPEQEAQLGVHAVGAQPQKLAQNISVRTKTASVKASKLAKRRRQVSCIAAVIGAFGKTSYEKAGGSKRLAIHARTGKVIVKKGTRKGTYKIQAKITAKATNAYSQSNAVYKTLKVKVRGS